MVWSYTTTANLTRAQDETWHVTWNPALFAPNLTGSEKLTLTTVAAKRGDIVGANSTPLMTQRDTAQVGIDKTKVGADQQQAAATALAQLVGTDPAAYAKAVAAAGAKAFVPLIIVRADDPILTTQTAAVAAIPGAVSIPGKSVIGPSPNFARSILGTVGEATAELVQKSNGALKAGDVVGLSGLEQRYDARLRGTPGRTIQAVGTDAAGKKSSRDLFTSPAVDGKPLVVTLDATAQSVAEAVLQGSSTNTPTSLVVVRPSTGEIVAAANGPGSNGLAGRDHGPGGSGLDLQDRHGTGSAPRRPHPGLAGLVHPDRQRRRPVVQELQRLPAEQDRAPSRSGPRSPTPATPRSSPTRTRSRRPTSRRPPPPWA